jgi:hypothetical protein
MLLLEIPQVASRYGEPTTPPAPPNPGPQADAVGPLVQPTIGQVMATNNEYVFTGPLLWLATRLARNRERAGVHYRSDSLASRWLAGALWALLTKPPAQATEYERDPLVPDASPPNAVGKFLVRNSHLIDSPALRRVIAMAKTEWY